MTLAIKSDGDEATAAEWNVLVRNANPYSNPANYGAVLDGVADDATAFAAAVTSAAAANNGLGGTVMVSGGTIRLASNQSVPSNVTLQFMAGGRISQDAATTLTVLGRIQASESHIFTGSGSFALSRTPYIYARWFGAKGDDSTDDSAAMQAWLTACAASRNATGILGSGVFRHATTLTITGSNKGIWIEGVPFGGMQQGSVDAESVLKWTGGASAQLDLQVSFSNVQYVAFQNFGAATCAIQLTEGGRFQAQDVSFPSPNGSAQYSLAAIDVPNGSDYSSLSRCEFEVSPALRLRGIMTWFELDRCVFDAANGVNPVIDCDASMDLLGFQSCTFNSQTNCNTFFDNSASAQVISVISMERCEFDGNAVPVQSYIAKVKGARIFRFHACQVSSFSTGAAEPIQLTDVGRADIEHVDGSSITQKLAKALGTTRVFVGPYRMNMSNSKGVLSGQSGNIVAVTPSGGSARLHAEQVSAKSPAVFVVTATVGTAFEVQIAAPEDGDGGCMEPGQVFVVGIKNASGGVLAAPTFSAAFKTSGAFTSPANSFSRSIGFYYDGVNAFELWRSAADVAN